MRILALILLTLPAFAQDIRFQPVDLYAEVSSDRLAAYQVELRYPARVKIVGLEGGDGAFAAPPFYDRAGLEGGRIVLAAFSIKSNALKDGPIRVARLHLQVEGGAEPDIQLSPMTAGASNGSPLRPTFTIRPVQGD